MFYKLRIKWHMHPRMTSGGGGSSASVRSNRSWEQDQGIAESLEQKWDLEDLVLAKASTSKSQNSIFSILNLR